MNRTVNVSWYLNDSLLHTNVSTKEANYTLHAEYVGEHNVSAIAENANGTDIPLACLILLLRSITGSSTSLSADLTPLLQKT